MLSKSCESFYPWVQTHPAHYPLDAPCGDSKTHTIPLGAAAGGAVDQREARDRPIGALPEPPRQTIVWGGAGRTTEAIAADEVRQMQAMARPRGEQRGVWVRNFTDRETPQARAEIVPGSGNGCLDGGVALRFWTGAARCRSRVGVSGGPVPRIPVSSGSAGAIAAHRTGQNTRHPPAIPGLLFL